MGAGRHRSGRRAQCFCPPTHSPSNHPHAVRQLRTGWFMGECQQRRTGPVILNGGRSRQSRRYQLSLAKRFRRQHHLRAEQLRLGTLCRQRRNTDVPNCNARLEHQRRHVGPGNGHLLARITRRARARHPILCRSQWQYRRDDWLEVQRGSAEHRRRSRAESPLVSLGGRGCDLDAARGQLHHVGRWHAAHDPHAQWFSGRQGHAR